MTVQVDLSSGGCGAGGEYLLELLLTLELGEELVVAGVVYKKEQSQAQPPADNTVNVTGGRYTTHALCLTCICLHLC